MQLFKKYEKAFYNYILKIRSQAQVSFYQDPTYYTYFSFIKLNHDHSMLHGIQQGMSHI